MSREYRDHYFPGTEELGSSEIRITALGTGRPFIRPAQANTSWLIELGNEKKFIFDFGYGSFRNFSALEIPVASIDAFFASHLHADHVGDFGAHWIAGWISGRSKAMQIYGPSGVKEEFGTKHFIHHQIKSYAWDSVTRHGDHPAVGAEVNVHEFNWQSEEVIFDSEGVVVKSFPAVHFYGGAVGFRIEWKGLTVVYSGDTAPNKIFVNNAANADVVIHEVFNTVNHLIKRSGLPESAAQNIGSNAHTQPDAAGKVFHKVNPRLAVAFHFFNDFDTRYEIYEEIRKEYSGELALAEDRMVFNITKDLIKVRLAITAEHVWPNKAHQDKFRSAPKASRSLLPNWLEEAKY